MNKVLTKRQINALRTKKVLFKSALKLFAQKGYDEVTVDEIVTAAGTSKGSFYTYFKSKYQIIIEQFKQIDEHYIQIEKELSKYTTASEKLLFFVKEQLIFSSNKMGLEVITLAFASQLSKEEEKVILNTDRPLFKIVNKIMEEGQRSGEFRNDLSVTDLTNIVTRCMRSLFFEWCIHNGNYDFAEDGQKFFSEVVLRGLIQNKEDAIE